MDLAWAETRSAGRPATGKDHTKKMLDLVATIVQIRKTGEGWESLRKAVVSLTRRKLRHLDCVSDADIQDVTQNALIRIWKSLHKVNTTTPKQGAAYLLLIISGACGDYGRSLSVRDRCIKPPNNIRSIRLRARASGIERDHSDFAFDAMNWIHLAGHRPVDRGLFESWLQGIPFTVYAKSAGYSTGYVGNRWKAAREHLANTPDELRDALADLQLTTTLI